VAKSKRKRPRKRGPTPPQAQGRRLSEEERELAARAREIERALAVMERRAAEAHAPDTPPEVVAAILAEDFGEMPSPVGFADTLAKQSLERARAVAAEVQRLAPGSLVALTFAAEVARIVDGDVEQSVALLEEAIDSSDESDAPGAMGMHLIGAGMALEALDAAEECLGDDPGDETGQTVLAAALGRLHDRAQAGERLTATEREALERFADRGLLYRLRDSIGELVEQRPALQELVASTVREWLEELEGDGVISLDDLAEAADAGLDGRYEPIMRLAIERAWLREQDDGLDDDDDAPAPELEDSTAPLALLATDPGTPFQISLAAQNWLETCTYGLWQVADPAPGPGVWLTEIVSGARRYAAIPSEQLQHASRWSVFLGALVAVDGIWRSTGTLVPMRPAEGDAAASLVDEATESLIRALSGKRARGRTARSGDPKPHGVLVEMTEAADPMLADLISKIVCNLLPSLAGELWGRRAAGAGLTNTDGHRLALITGLVRVDAAAAAAERLAAHEDFRTEEDGELTWWGRELSELERQTALATIRAEAGEDEAQYDETPRWLRGRLKPGDGGFEVEVNSEERLQMLLEMLGKLGLGAELTRKSVIDPRQDMPPIPFGGLMRFGASQEAVDVWLEHWPSEPIPALGRLTPRVAARRKDKRPRLEALLREFEHDAYQLARDGEPAPDIGRLRQELGFTSWWNDA
jgi:hypothetical protein